MERVSTKLENLLPVQQFLSVMSVLNFVWISLKKRLNELYSKHSGKNVEQIKDALERDNFMTPENAKDFGLVDQVVEKRI